MKSMKYLPLFILLFAAGASLSPAAQNTASNFFNEAAFLYTDQKTDEALELTKQGLARYPDDVPLIKLKELLEKQQQQEQQQQQQEQEQQQNQEQQNKDQQQNQDQQKNDEQDKQQEQEQQDDQQKKDQEKQKEQQQQQNQQQQAGQQEQRAEEMTPEEAQMLLDAMRDDEKAQRDALRMIMGAPEPPQNGKDW